MWIKTIGKILVFVTTETKRRQIAANFIESSWKSTSP